MLKRDTSGGTICNKTFLDEELTFIAQTQNCSNPLKENSGLPEQTFSLSKKVNRRSTECGLVRPQSNPILFSCTNRFDGKIQKGKWAQKTT